MFAFSIFKPTGNPTNTELYVQVDVLLLKCNALLKLGAKSVLVAVALGPKILTFVKIGFVIGPFVVPVASLSDSKPFEPEISATVESLTPTAN